MATQITATVKLPLLLLFRVQIKKSFINKTLQGQKNINRFALVFRTTGHFV